MRSKIILFQSNLKYAGVPLALLSLTKMLKAEKYDLRLVTAREYPAYEEEILRNCKDALCFGVSCVTGTPIKTALAVSKRVKEKYPSLPIIWGGWQAITLAEETLRSPYVDYLCRGQGERTFYEFVKMLENKDFKKVGKILGLSYKKKGVIVHNQRREVEDLNQFPDFDLDLINWEKYLEITDFGTKALRIATSYGCPYRCRFCCVPYSSGGRWKPLSAERIISFLKKLMSRVDFDGLIIVDDNFFVEEQRVIKFCEGLLEQPLKIKLGQVNGRTNNLVSYKESTWKLLKQVGLYNVLVGAESADEETLKFINKGATVEDTYTLAQLCQKYGIKLIVSMMVGLPTPAYAKNPKRAFADDFWGITKLYKDLLKLSPDTRLLLFPYAPFPFSPLYDRVVELGFVPPQNLEEWAAYELTEIHVPWLPKAGFPQIEMLNYISILLGVDFSPLRRSLPFMMRVVFGPALWLFKGISEVRLSFSFFYFPLDRWVFNLGVRIFGKMKKVR